MGIQLDAGCVRHINPNMHVRFAAEIPDERRAFEPPVVPGPVFAKIPFLVESEPTGIETALDFQTASHLVSIRLAERFQQQFQDGLQMLFLV